MTQKTQSTKVRTGKANTGKAAETPMTIGKLAEVLLTAGKTGPEVLAGIKRVFPGAETKMKSVYWYASQLGIKLRKGAAADQGELKKLMKSLRAA